MLVFSTAQIGIVAGINPTVAGGGNPVFTCPTCEGPFCLSIVFKTLFSLASESPPRDRWQGGPDADKVVPGAVVTVGNQRCITDSAGLVSFDAEALGTGVHALCVDAAVGERSAAPAGRSTARYIRNPPRRLFRRIEGQVGITVGASTAHFTSVTIDPTDADHARLFTPIAAGTTPARVTIDWKPDFIGTTHFTDVVPGATTRTARYFIVHRTGESTNDISGSLVRFMGGSSTGASAHFLVDRDGFVVKLVQDRYASNHMLDGFWRGSVQIQAESIGVEIVGAKTINGVAPESPLEPVQYDRVASLIRQYGVSTENVAAHADVRVQSSVAGQAGLVPNVTDCPFWHFSWASLAQRGVAVAFHQPASAPDATLDLLVGARYPEGLAPDLSSLLASGPPAWTGGMIRRLKADLRKIGYSVDPDDGVTVDDDAHNAALEWSLARFRLRFMDEARAARYLDFETARVMASVIVNMGLVYQYMP